MLIMVYNFNNPIKLHGLHNIIITPNNKRCSAFFAITYTDASGKENWLPFVNEQGRLLAPNWGRVHSMWANIAVTPTIDNTRLHKFIMKVTAFWGQQLGLNLNTTVFHIHLKKISAPNYWVYDQLHKNFSSPWLTIGEAQWHDNKIIYHLPNDINSL